MRKGSTRLFSVLALALAIGLAAAASPFASSSPDGLERVAEDKAFSDRGELHPAQKSSPLPDYAFPGIEDARLATGVAGFVGTLSVFALGLGGGALLRRRGTNRAASGDRLTGTTAAPR